MSTASHAADNAAPLSGIRVLALEQMQALPVATRLLLRLGADVVKVEPPGAGESGRASQPTIKDKAGKDAGSNFVRFGLGKKSITVNLKSPEGKALILDLIPHFDVVCENLGPNRANRLGIGYEAARAVHPGVVYMSISGFGNSGGSPYSDWPAYAGVAEAMSGAYEYSRRPHQPPIVNPFGGMGDTSAGLFGIIGVLAALRQRERTGRGQFVDIAMFDAMIAMCDQVPTYWSLGRRREPDKEVRAPLLAAGFKASDGWFMIQISRKHQFERLAAVLDKPEWLTDERFASTWGWTDHLEDVIRPGIEAWAANKTKLDASRTLAQNGVVAAPCFSAEDLVQDPHVAARDMLFEVPRLEPDKPPVLLVGNPVKLSDAKDIRGEGYATVGEHTEELLRDLLGLDAQRIAQLRGNGAI